MASRYAEGCENGEFQELYPRSQPPNAGSGHTRPPRGHHGYEGGRGSRFSRPRVFSSTDRTDSGHRRNGDDENGGWDTRGAYGGRRGGGRFEHSREDNGYFRDSYHSRGGAPFRGRGGQSSYQRGGRNSDDYYTDGIRRSHNSHENYRDFSYQRSPREPLHHQNGFRRMHPEQDDEEPRHHNMGRSSGNFRKFDDGPESHKERQGTNWYSRGGRGGFNRMHQGFERMNFREEDRCDRPSYGEYYQGPRNFASMRGERRPSRGLRSSRGGPGNRYFNPGDMANATPAYIPKEDPSDESEIFGTGVSSGINFDKYNDIPVQITGEDMKNAQEITLKSFEDAGLNSLLLTNIGKAHFTKPTPVQAAAIPIIKMGRDVMTNAQTGSGKTVAFLLPILHQLLETEDLEDTVINNVSRPHCVIMVPTRELARQIHNEVRKFAFGSFIRSVDVYGGTNINHATDRLLRGANIVVATPGRLMDVVKRSKMSLANVKYVVLDEADRMVDAGFLPSMEFLLNKIDLRAPGDRQTMMFSATFPERIQELASKFLFKYIFILVGSIGGACDNVQQNFYTVGKFDKNKTVEEIIRREEDSKILVFVERRKYADYLASFLSGQGIQTMSVHGDRTQEQREDAVRDFIQKKRRILVATSVCARGLDIPEVDHVINYDLPTAIEDYIHRIGRTGRMGNRGKATSFYDPVQDRHLANALIAQLVNAQQNVPEFLRQEAALADAGERAPLAGRPQQFSSTDYRRRQAWSEGGRAPPKHFSSRMEPEGDWDD